MRIVALVCSACVVLSACPAAPPVPDGKQLQPSLGFQPSGHIENVVIDDAPCRGSAQALVTIVEFTDFECSHCARAQEVLALLEQNYAQQLRVCFRHRPIPLHFFSRDAAEAAEAAKSQGRFWQMHDVLFAHQHDLSAEALRDYARRIGLDLERFDRDRFSESIMQRVDYDEEIAATLSIKAAPTLFINGRRLIGVKSVEEVESLVQLGLDDARRALAAGVAQQDLYSALVSPAAHAKKPRTKVLTPVAIAGEDPCRGPSDAALTIVEFTDFECPFCSQAKASIDAIEQRYAGKIRLCVKMNPLSYHRFARRAALWALAAHKQGRFFDVYDDLFANQEALDDISLNLRARSLGFDVEKLQSDASSTHLERQLQRHLDEAKQAQLKGTPSFIIGDEMVFGAQPLDIFDAAVQRQLDR